MASSAIAGSALVDLPSGMVIPYAGSGTPAGWLECNGAEVDISAYPRLAAALGSTWNTAKNPLTNANYAAPAAGKFRLPDMRGAFLRGSSGGSNNAQGVATGLAEFQVQRTAKNGLSNAASGISALSLNNADLTHTHTSQNLNINGGFSASGSGGIHSVAGSGGLTLSNALGNHAHSLSSGTAAAQTISSADAETRPDAVGVRYLIKI
jgi:microcystin-dependent protein